MTITLIPCDATEWREEGRLLGRVELPLTPAGEALSALWAQGLKSADLSILLHAKDELSTMFSKRLARTLAIHRKSVAGLDEIELGLWSGLTQDQLHSRYESAYEELTEAPLNVSPPEGESFHEAFERLHKALTRILKSYGPDGRVAIVLRPFALALVRYILNDSELTPIWDVLEEVREPRMIAAGGLRDA